MPITYTPFEKKLLKQLEDIQKTLAKGDDFTFDFDSVGIIKEIRDMHKTIEMVRVELDKKEVVVNYEEQLNDMFSGLNEINETLKVGFNSVGIKLDRQNKLLEDVYPLQEEEEKGGLFGKKNKKDTRPTMNEIEKEKDVEKKPIFDSSSAES